MENSETSQGWHEGTRAVIEETLRDRILSALLQRSNLTGAQFETLLVDQLGHDMANKRLTRSDMAQLRRDEKGINRGSFNRNLMQGGEDGVGANYTFFALWHSWLTECSNISPFLQSSERL